ncbi:hypothetical protein PR048_030195 [Dryococelus australis]|uniref:Uncharacterized protein n=1 Tax=Dryococelus australis TaxID=614101 RepID=A0ABQ9G891_9NEOP|nr:hypothetical protein PR048_030195 [Dryococelus australis]
MFASCWISALTWSMGYDASAFSLSKAQVKTTIHVVRGLRFVYSGSISEILSTSAITLRSQVKPHLCRVKLGEELTWRKPPRSLRVTPAERPAAPSPYTGQEPIFSEGCSVHADPVPLQFRVRFSEGYAAHRGRCTLAVNPRTCTLTPLPDTDSPERVFRISREPLGPRSPSSPPCRSKITHPCAAKIGLFRMPDLPWRSRSVRRRSGVREALGSNPGSPTRARPLTTHTTAEGAMRQVRMSRAALDPGQQLSRTRFLIGGPRGVEWISPPRDPVHRNQSSGRRRLVTRMPAPTRSLPLTGTEFIRGLSTSAFIWCHIQPVKHKGDCKGERGKTLQMNAMPISQVQPINYITQPPFARMPRFPGNLALSDHVASHSSAAADSRAGVERGKRWEQYTHNHHLPNPARQGKLVSLSVSRLHERTWSRSAPPTHAWLHVEINAAPNHRQFSFQQDSYCRVTRRNVVYENITLARPISTPAEANRVQSPAGSTEFSQVGIVPDDAVGRRVFSVISRFPRPFIPAPLCIHSNDPHLAVRSRPNISSLFTAHSTDWPVCNSLQTGFQRLVFDLTVSLIWVWSVGNEITPEEEGSQQTTAITFPKLLCILWESNLDSRGRRPATVSLLASHQGDPGSIPGGITSNFRMWGSCRTTPLVGGFTRGSPVSPALSFRPCSVLILITPIGSQDLDVKSRPTPFSHSLDSLSGRSKTVPHTLNAVQ